MSIPPSITPPSITVLVCTKDRGDAVVASLHSILADQSIDFELLVLDQSESDATELAVSSVSDPRLRYVRLTTVGLSNARNAGLRLSTGDVVLMTDDDCRVAPGWVRTMADLLNSPIRPSCVFCTVEPADHDSEEGFIPHALQRGEETVDDPRRFDAGRGIGAGMAVWRQDAIAAGGFDPLLGAGARFRSGEEGDLALRLCQAGRSILYSDRTSVVHDGFRTHADGRLLTRGYMYGTAATFGKHLRCGRWSVAHPLRVMIVDCILRPIWTSIGERRVPRVAGRIVYTTRGLVEGALHPVDRATCVLRAPAADPELAEMTP